MGIKICNAAIPRIAFLNEKYFAYHHLGKPSNDGISYG